MGWPDLSGILGDLRWAVAGAVAARRYMPERATRDLDVVVLAADAAEARSRLGSAGFVLRGELSIGGTEWRAPDGTPIDLIEVGESWWERALQDAKANRDDEGSPVLTLPYLVLMKMQASRPQDVADISRMLGAATAQQVADARSIVARHSPDDVEDFDSLLELGRLEHPG
jgi:hypothetical protein